jgi:glycogen operon protein
LDFELPPVDNGSQKQWRRWIDTSLESPLDIAPWQTAPSIPGSTYRAESRSVVVLFADLTGASE